MFAKYRISRRKALGLIGGGAAASLVKIPVDIASAQTLDKVVFQTNWRAQAEHGGYYQAVAAGLYKKAGIECDLRMGGPQQNPSQLLLAGRADLIMSTSFEALSYVKENIPFLCIGAIMQKDPQVLIAHPGQGNDDLAKLKGKPILIGAGGRVTYWPFLRAKFGYTDDQIRPYTFNMGPFLADKKAIQQGYLSSEPYAIRQAGVEPVVMLIADSGYDNYATTINTSQKMADEKSDLVQRFVNASLEGWDQYLKGGAAIEAANAVIKKDNPEMSDDKIAYAIKVMNEKGIVKSGDATKLGIGAMTDERWERFYKTMSAAGVFPADLAFKKAYSLKFVNKGIGA